MFRRKKKSLSDNFRDTLWPRMGWLRVFRYYGLRLYRLNDTPYAVSAGFASGVAISFTPFLGFHLIIGALLARIFNGSIIASLIGTLAGNPWTFPFIWIFTYKIGLYILGSVTPDSIPHDLSFSTMWEHPTHLFIPMMIGSIPCAIIGWILSFYSCREIVVRFQRQRMRRRALARLKEVKRQRDLDHNMRKVQYRLNKRRQKKDTDK